MPYTLVRVDYHKSLMDSDSLDKQLRQHDLQTWRYRDEEVGNLRYHFMKPDIYPLVKVPLQDGGTLVLRNEGALSDLTDSDDDSVDMEISKVMREKGYSK